MTTFETVDTIQGAPITVKIIADSITDGGCRVTTAEWSYWRAIHSEIMTHGALRRNAASSRAIPAAKLRQRVVDLPFIPGHWGQNQAGMQAHKEVDDQKAALDWWLRGRDLMAAHHEEGEKLGLHKQVINRVIEPWMMITIIVTATDWANFFHLRRHADAEPNFQRLANLMWDAYLDNTPTYVPQGGWHLPYIREDDPEACLQLFKEDPKPGITEAHGTLDLLKKVSTGRCARVSYLTHAGIRDVREDVGLHDKLLGSFETGGPGHFSPFEHPCEALGTRRRIGPFAGWKQYRKFFPYEAGPDTSDRCERCGLWGKLHTKNCPAAT